MKTPTIINIVSGKGGTGKTLMNAVLADFLGLGGISVLVIDLDISVRGLTALLYFHKGESLSLIDKSQFSVAELFVKKVQEQDSSNIKKLGISRYNRFDVLPAVSRIDANLNFNDILPASKEEAVRIIKSLLDMVPHDYDLILLDSRAGYDEMVAATHNLSNASVCVEEDDSISKITSDNLIRQLKNDSDNPVFRLTNKSRQNEESSTSYNENLGVTDLGKIPFDIDVMNSFGAKNFWEEIPRTIYRSGLITVWNRLMNKMELNWHLTDTRISPLSSQRIEKSFGALSWKDRIFMLYGLMITGLGFGFGFMDPEFLYYLMQDPQKLASIGLGTVGLFMVLWVAMRIGVKH